MLLYTVAWLWFCWTVVLTVCILNEDAGELLIKFFKWIRFTDEQNRKRNVVLRVTYVFYCLSGLPAFLITKGISGLPEYCGELYYTVRRVFDQDYKR
jgi:hypothetical protein